ncbi:hypothetical protein ABZY57_31875, partial [Streptomyces sp. NPDC006450]
MSRAGHGAAVVDVAAWSALGGVRAAVRGAEGYWPAALLIPFAGVLLAVRPLLRRVFAPGGRVGGQERREFVVAGAYRSKPPRPIMSGRSCPGTRQAGTGDHAKARAERSRTLMEDEAEDVVATATAIVHAAAVRRARQEQVVRVGARLSAGAFLTGCPSGLWWRGDRANIPLVGEVLAGWGPGAMPYPTDLIGLMLLVYAALFGAAGAGALWCGAADVARRVNPLARYERHAPPGELAGRRRPGPGGGTPP